MKKLLLSLLLLGPLATQAQYYEAATLGVGLVSSALQKKPQDPTQYVTTFTRVATN